MDIFEGMEPASESRFITVADVGFRLGEWKPEAGHNILLVTGHSGSGKTTLSKRLATRKNHHHIELDWYDWFKSVRHPDNPDWVMFTECFHDLTGKDPRDLDRVRRVSMFEEGWMEFKKVCAKNPTQMYIVEGIQVITLMPKGGAMAKDPKTMPILIKGTSAYTSVKRARKRSAGFYQEGFLEMLIEWIGYDKRNRKFMADLVASGTAEDPEDFGIYD